MPRTRQMSKVAASMGMTDDDPRFIKMVTDDLRAAGSTEKAAPKYELSGRRLFDWLKSKNIMRAKADYVQVSTETHHVD